MTLVCYFIRGTLKPIPPAWTERDSYRAFLHAAFREGRLEHTECTFEDWKAGNIPLAVVRPKEHVGQWPETRGERPQLWQGPLRRSFYEPAKLQLKESAEVSREAYVDDRGQAVLDHAHSLSPLPPMTDEEMNMEPRADGFRAYRRRIGYAGPLLGKAPNFLRPGKHERREPVPD